MVCKVARKLTFVDLKTYQFKKRTFWTKFVENSKICLKLFSQKLKFMNFPNNCQKEKKSRYFYGTKDRG